jgi:hypothetical protein
MARNINPPPGSIKSIQRGVISLSGSSATATATITAVDTSKSLLNHLGTLVNTDDARQITHLTFTNATTITATRSASTSGTQEVSFQVVEYY